MTDLRGGGESSGDEMDTGRCTQYWHTSWCIDWGPSSCLRGGGGGGEGLARGSGVESRESRGRFGRCAAASPPVMSTTAAAAAAGDVVSSSWGTQRCSWTGDDWEALRLREKCSMEGRKEKKGIEGI